MPAVGRSALVHLTMLGTALALPRISPKVPVAIDFAERNGKAHLEEILEERLIRGWRTTLPDPAVHKHPVEALEQTLQRLAGGYKVSETYVTTAMCTYEPAMNTESGASLDNYYSVEVGSVVVNLGGSIARLEKTTKGLGETIIALLDAPSLKGAIPGAMFAKDVHGLYRHYRLEDWDEEKYSPQEEDEIARQFLLDAGYEADDVDNHLPSAFSEGLGGRMFTHPQVRIPKSELSLHLERAGFKDREEFLQLLLTDYPKAYRAARKAIDPVEDFYWGRDMIDVLICGREGDDFPAAITDFIDDRNNDRMQCGDPEFAFAVNRLAECRPQPGKGKGKGRGRGKKKIPAQGVESDGLKVTALMLKAYSLLDRMLVLLKQHEPS